MSCQSYEKLQILSYDEDRVIEYNKRLLWFYDEVSKLECMKEVQESFKNAITELNVVQNELYDIKTELQDTQTEHKKTLKEMKKAQAEHEKKIDDKNKIISNMQLKNIELINNAIAMGLDMQTIIALTGLSAEEIKNFVD